MSSFLASLIAFCSSSRSRLLGSICGERIPRACSAWIAASSRAAFSGLTWKIQSVKAVPITKKLREIRAALVPVIFSSHPQYTAVGGILASPQLLKIQRLILTTVLKNLILRYLYREAMSQPKISCVYAIQNTVTGKSYVGSTKDAVKRWHAHKKQLRRGINHSIKLQRSWNKHGATVWKWVVLEECPENQLLVREQHYLDLFDSYRNGYNSSPTASSPNKGNRASVETREKLRQSHLGQLWISHPELGMKKVRESEIPVYLDRGWVRGRIDRIGIPPWNKDVPVPRKTRQQISFTLKHKRLRWMHHPQLGMKLVPERETEEKIRAGWVAGKPGVLHTVASKEKIRRAMVGTWATRRKSNGH